MRVLLSACLSVLAGAAFAAEPLIDDSDLGAPPLRALESQERLSAEAAEKGPAWVFPALEERAAGRGPSGLPLVTGSFRLEGREGPSRPARLGRARLVGDGAAEGWTPLAADGSFSLPAPARPSGEYRVRFVLDNGLWLLRNLEGASYAWETAPFPLSAGGGRSLGPLSPAPGSENARLGLLHLAYVDARDLLAREGDLAWWEKPLTVRWPGEGNFFRPWAWSLDLTDAGAWDVNLHELGHAVMHGAMKPAPAGGKHYIDRCYTEALAWSEGWASFFAAAVRLRRDDPDARFEFLVPRMAPIRLERVPGGVCEGPTSEWRVMAGLWDLHDTHADGGEESALSFRRLWTALRGRRHGSVLAGWALLRDGLSQEERGAAERALVLNTLLPERPALWASLPRFPPPWPSEPR